MTSGNQIKEQILQRTVCGANNVCGANRESFATSVSLQNWTCSASISWRGKGCLRGKQASSALLLLFQVFK